MRKLRIVLVLCLGIVASASCDDEDVVAYSETVSTKLSGIKAGDIDNGVASEDKNINTEEGNPYGDFLKTARARLGRDPSAIEVTSIVVQVNADSKDVIAVDQVLADLEVFFADGATTVPVGHVDAPTGSSVIVPIDDALVLEPVMDAMLGGDFKVGLRGAAIADPPADFELKLTLDVRFRAIE